MTDKISVSVDVLMRAVHVVRTFCAYPPLTVSIETRRFVPAVEMLRAALRQHGAELGLEPCTHDPEKVPDGIRAHDFEVCCELCAPDAVKRWEKENEE